jgi:cyclophilin family peptidyl-prolyl cis-trans isomerase
MGVLSMDSDAPNTNNSRFLITLKAAPHLDGKHVIFGRVLAGFDVLRTLASVDCKVSGKPKKTVSISRCGIVQVDEETEDQPKFDTAVMQEQLQEKVKQEITDAVTDAIQNAHSTSKRAAHVDAPKKKRRMWGDSLSEDSQSE